MKISAPAVVTGKGLLSCIEMDELTELGNMVRRPLFADRGPRDYSYEHMHIDLYKCDALHGVNSKLNTIEYAE